MGAMELQIFVSLMVVLGAAFVALICDFLKGNNEKLREANIELLVRQHERELADARTAAATASARAAPPAAKQPLEPVSTPKPEPSAAPSPALWNESPEYVPRRRRVRPVPETPAGEPVAPGMAQPVQTPAIQAMEDWARHLLEPKLPTVQTVVDVAPPAPVEGEAPAAVEPAKVPEASAVALHLPEPVSTARPVAGTASAPLAGEIPPPVLPMEQAVTAATHIEDMPAESTRTFPEAGTVSLEVSEPLNAARPVAGTASAPLAGEIPPPVLPMEQAVTAATHIEDMPAESTRTFPEAGTVSLEVSEPLNAARHVADSGSVAPLSEEHPEPAAPEQRVAAAERQPSFSVEQVDLPDPNPSAAILPGGGFLAAPAWPLGQVTDAAPHVPGLAAPVAAERVPPPVAGPEDLTLPEPAGRLSARGLAAPEASSAGLIQPASEPVHLAVHRQPVPERVEFEPEEEPEPGFVTSLLPLSAAGLRPVPRLAIPPMVWIVYNSDRDVGIPGRVSSLAEAGLAKAGLADPAVLAGSVSAPTPQEIHSKPLISEIETFRFVSSSLLAAGLAPVEAPPADLAAGPSAAELGPVASHAGPIHFAWETLTPAAEVMIEGFDFEGWAAVLSGIEAEAEAAEPAEEPDDVVRVRVLRSTASPAASGSGELPGEVVGSFSRPVVEIEGTGSALPAQPVETAEAAGSFAYPSEPLAVEWRDEELLAGTGLWRAAEAIKNEEVTPEPSAALDEAANAEPPAVSPKPLAGSETAEPVQALSPGLFEALPPAPPIESEIEPVDVEPVGLEPGEVLEAEHLIEPRSNVVRMPAPSGLSVEEPVRPLRRRMPPGLLPRELFSEVANEILSFEGVVFQLGILGYDHLLSQYGKHAVRQAVEVAGNFFETLLGETGSACWAEDAVFVMAVPGDGRDEVRRLNQQVSEALWDYQLRSLGSLPLIFHWGSVEGSGEPLLDVLERANDQMVESGRARKQALATSGRFRRRVVNG